MAKYSVTYRDAQGKVLHSGDPGAIAHVDASSVFEVYSKVQGVGGTVLSAKALSESRLAAWLDRVMHEKDIFGRLKWWVTLDEWAMLCDVLRALLSAGVPVLRAVRLTSADSSNPALGRRLGRVAELVEKGQSLSGAMEMQGKKFPKVLVSAIRSGEKIGEVPVSLEKMAQLFRRKAEIKREISQAIIYPVVCIIVFVVVCGVITFIVPPNIEEALGVKLEEGTKEFREMKLPLQIIFRVYKHPSLVLLPIGAVVGWFVLLAVARRMNSTRLVVARMDRKVPLVGKLQAEFALVDFIESLTLNQNSGIKISESLSLISETSSDLLIQDAVVRVRERIVSEGASLSGAIAPEDVFPGLLRQMIASAEAGGRLGEMLEPVAEFYDLSARAMLKKMISAMEPVILISLGLVIGPVVGSVYDFLMKLGKWVN